MVKDTVADNTAADTQHPFTRRLNAYYKQWVGVGDTVQRLELLQVTRLAKGISIFTRNLNQHLKGLRAEDQSVTEDGFRAFLSGEAIPSPAQLKAMCLELRLYGDSRELMEELAESARLASARAKEQAVRNRLEPMRRSNPGRDLSLPSFTEMLEESYQAKCTGSSEESINTLLWDRVFKTWKRGEHDFSPEQFCSLIEANNQGKEGKGRLTNTTIYNWRNHPDKYKPIADSVETICKAFGLTPEGEKPAAEAYAHEVMLWKVIGGRAFRNPYPSMADQKPEDTLQSSPSGELDAAIAAAKKTGNHGPLVRELIDASGISMSRLQKTLLRCQQLHQWADGAHVQDVETAKRFLALTNPVTDASQAKKIQAQNNEILEILTGRIFDIPRILAEAQKKPDQPVPGQEEGQKSGPVSINHGGKLLSLLTGRTGLVSISAADLAQELTSRGHTVSQEKVKKMRVSVFERGGRITEPLARSIIDIVQEKSATEFTPEEIESSVDILTNCPSASKLLQQCVKGEMAVGEMVRQTYERKGLRLEDVQKQVELAHLSNFLLGKASLDFDSARKLCSWLGFQHEERRQFMVLATGHTASINPSAILDQVRTGELSRVEGLRLVYDASGMTRAELSRESGVDISYSVTEKSQGRIIAPVSGLRKLSQLCGLSERTDDFAETFGGQWVAQSHQPAAGSRGINTK